MALKVPVSQVLKEALVVRDQDSFERCLGESVRRQGGSYQDYIDLVSRVRETANRRKVTLREAARFLADQP
ncbi:MAG TPA: hypothetical protein VEY12_11460 [Thermoplasmata archaeon]|nr:hypothetical protein [Thermoplasmata archaeon]